MKPFVDQHRDRFGVEPICSALQIAPSGYWREAARSREPTLCPMAKAACPLDRVNRQFKAERPNQLWVSDFTYVSTWQGFVYVAFVVDVFARSIVRWRVSSSMKADFVLDALEQALYARKGQRDGELRFLGWYGYLALAFGFAAGMGDAGKVCGVQSIGTRVGALGSCDA